MKLELNPQQISVKKLSTKLGAHSSRFFLCFLTKYTFFNYRWKQTIRNNSWMNFFLQYIHTINVGQPYQIWLQSGYSIRRNKLTFQASKLCSHPQLGCPPFVPPLIWPIFAPFTNADNIFFGIMWNRVEFCPSNESLKAFCPFVWKISTSK